MATIIYHSAEYKKALEEVFKIADEGERKAAHIMLHARSVRDSKVDPHYTDEEFKVIYGGFKKYLKTYGDGFLDAWCQCKKIKAFNSARHLPKSKQMGFLKKLIQTEYANADKHTFACEKCFPL